MNSVLRKANKREKMLVKYIGESACINTILQKAGIGERIRSKQKSLG